ncbi:hypothetical protein WA026_011555 [Henosepilachna vigintioctopunctata]|uniref:Insulin-like domain-containing protein n=1 Tax=Henosepilachna vigintioctopunctata TaxID=420089 RepID=A0AAW1TLY5_9CUCU
MKMQFRIFVLFFTFLFLSIFMGSYESVHLYRRKHFFCGNRLVDTLSKMCKTYNDPTGVVMGENDQAGIIETCCEQPCTLNVLATYCGTLKQKFIINFQ